MVNVESLWDEHSNNRGSSDSHYEVTTETRPSLTQPWIHTYIIVR